MKKKFLSLMMAAAMVATTSVSAFADDTTTHEIQKGTEKNVEVKIEGNIAANDGTVLPSTVTVTVPTSASFTVKKDGSLTSATMNITSNGDSAVSVIASKFIDTNGQAGINIIKDGDINSREKIKLKLTGGDQDIILSSETNSEGTLGKMYKSDGSTEITDSLNFVIGNVTKDTPLKLRLEGEGKASSDTSDAAIQDNFKLVLKIKKER